MRRWGKNLTSVTGNLAKCLRTSSSVNRGGSPRTNIRDDSIAVVILNYVRKRSGRVDASKNLQVLHALTAGTSVHDGSAALALCVFRRQQHNHPAATNNRAIALDLHHYTRPLPRLQKPSHLTLGVFIQPKTMASEKSDTHKQEGRCPMFIPRVSLRAQLTMIAAQIKSADMVCFLGSSTSI
jgi:hypothetical protein